MPPPALPSTAPMAALRTLRRASWGACDFADLEVAAKTVLDPLAELNATWTAVVGSLHSYQRHRDALAWGALQSALSRFDGALASFFGPSGWERPA